MRFSPVLGWVLAYLVLAFLFLSPEVGNHSEAEDAFTYAREVEVEGYREILHPHHRLYHPLIKAVYELSGAERSYPVLVAVSQGAALLALFFFSLLLRELGVKGEGRRFVFVAGLAFSYGFWRYTHEVEAYTVGSAVAMMILWLFFRCRGAWRGVVMAVGLVLALNVHRALGPPLLLAGGTLLVGQKEWRSLALFVISAGGLYLAAEWTAGQVGEPSRQGPEFSGFFYEEQTVERSQDRAGTKLSPASLPKAAIGLGSSVVATNLLMGVDPVFEFLQKRLFPYRFLQEERLLAQGQPIWFQALWALLLVATLAGIAFFLWQVVRDWQQWRTWAPASWALLVATGGYAGMIVIFEPGNPEMWLLGVPFFWLVAALLMRAVSTRSLAVWTVVFAGGNFLGGMALLAEEEKDYHFVTSRFIRAEGRPQDWYLLGYRGAVQARFVRYRVGALQVVPLPRESEKFASFYHELTGELSRGRRVFVHTTVLERPASFGVSLADFGLSYRPGPTPGGGGEIVLAAPGDEPHSVNSAR
ncbi:hypothetical protein [Roseibacillus ishigakijimensis]|uniref:Uncharacterized protein n=2 Tax=Roseibacillus ishigakijimensis TaxID=454146 RepID=A0A934VMR6_9BACT|nr:hypothetical protein [Roseibacillus ishigakijimensis]